MSRQISREFVYAEHPVARVWRALSQRTALAAWLAPNDFLPEGGRRFQVETDDVPVLHGVLDCQVLAVEPERHLLVSCRRGYVDVRVDHRIEAADPDGQGTRLHVQVSQLDGPRGAAVGNLLRAALPYLYGRRLPMVLERLEAGAPPSGWSEDTDHQRGVVAQVTRALPSLLGRRS